MLSRFDVSLNGVSLLETVPEITILDVEHTPAQPQDETIGKGYMSGAILLNRKYSSSQVVVYYDLSVYSPALRHEITMAVQKWAFAGGTLQTTDRPGQHLKVRCAQFPSVGSALRWTEKLSIPFVAYETPFWLNDEEDTVSFATGGTFAVGGCADYAQVSATIKASKGGTITYITVSCGDTTIKLNGISIPASSDVRIGYDGNGFLTIKTGGTSLMDKRTGSDELLAACGKNNAVSVQCNTNVVCTMTARGQWL